MNRLKNSRPAFSLIELMVVILIIALIVAILLPALGGVRQKARDAATRNLLQNLSQAFAAFEIDNKRLPGYFPESALGDAVNGQGAGRGLTSLENALFELSGGIDPSMVTPTGNWVKVGPYTDDTKNVCFNQDAVGKGKYFVPPPQYYKKTDGTQSAGTKIASATNHMAIWDLVDADGMPILAWMSDPGAVGPITNSTQLASVGSGSATAARFYMNSNHAMLASLNLGKKGVNQNTESLVGFDGTATNNAMSLAGILGSPGSPKNINLPPQQILPTAARGSFVLQAAGKNGIYVGRNERGGARADAAGILHYGLTFKTLPDSPLTDSDGKPTSSDLLKDFDDIVVSGGG